MGLFPKHTTPNISSPQVISLEGNWCPVELTHFTVSKVQKVLVIQIHSLDFPL